MQRIIFSLAFHIATIFSGGLLAATAAAQHQITYGKVIFEGVNNDDIRHSSELIFTIEGFRVDGACYHNCDISFSLFSLYRARNLSRAYLKLTRELLTSRISAGSAGQIFIGNRENTRNERNAISAFSEREKLVLAWIIEHSAELIVFATATDRIPSDFSDFWKSQEAVFPSRIEEVFSNALRGYRDRSEALNTNDHARAIIQPALAEIELYNGSIDGVAGRRTRAAVSAFQKERGRLVTGYADSEEREMLAWILNGGDAVEENAVDAGAAAQHEITYEKVIFERSNSAHNFLWSELFFTIEGFRIDGSCYHSCNISFSLHGSRSYGRADLKATQDLVASWPSSTFMFFGSTENTANERDAILALSQREKLALAWIIERSAELISFATATDRIPLDVADYWRSQENVFPTHIQRAFSTALRGYRDRIVMRNTNDQLQTVIQPALAEIGLYSGPIDGAASNRIGEAVAAFQKERERLVTGYADSEEREILAQLLLETIRTLRAELTRMQTPSNSDPETEVVAELHRRIGLANEAIVDLQAMLGASRQLAADRIETIRSLRVELSRARRSSDTEASAELRRQLEAANATIADLQAESVPRSELERLEERLVTIVTTLDPASPAAELPTFDAPTTPMSASISEHCNSINVLTSTNGGFTTLGAMTNPAFVLNEQFCLARTAAVAQAERAMGNVVDVTPAQLSAQCDGLGALMRPTLAALQDDDPADVINDVQATLTGSGQSMEQLASAGVVCLGLGYQADKAEVALGSALLMVGTGHSAYGEIVAHQLRGGFGTEHCEACAGAWLTATIASLEGGATPAFLPNQSADRIALLKAANAAH